VIADQSSSSSFVDDDRRNVYEDEGQQRWR